jgi:hypothetical protein
VCTPCQRQAAKALEVCLRTVTPKILTWGQYAEAAYNLFEKAVLGRSTGDYVPDFTQCVDHFALHAGEDRRALVLQCATCGGAEAYYTGCLCMCVIQ